MILVYLLKAGMLGRANREKLLFFMGMTGNPLYLSRRWPLVTSIGWLRALFVPRYARAVVAWLAYRVELYDGLQG